MCYSCRAGLRTYSSETRKKMSAVSKGRRFSLSTKEKLSTSSKTKYKNPLNLKIMTDAVKLAMHRPDVRKRHIEALHHSKWLKVRTDKGQLEMIEKWNRLGFRFEPNYQVHTNDFLYYIDGYDSEHNVVLEYDSQYHRKLSQQKKDAERERRIINILHPKKFWRYNSHTHSFTQILGG
jgi:very-short-patch-repair endonuclease